MEKIKLLTFYTDSHKELYEKYFLSSYKQYLKDDFKLLGCHYKQITKDISYGTLGFNQTMVGKVEHIIKNIDISDNNLMVFADCDIQFFKNIKEDIIEDIGDYDIKFQDDIVCVCAGLFVCKQNEKILSFFKDVLNTLLNTVKNGMDDQKIINYFLNVNKHPIKYSRLPKNKYFTVAASTGSKQWNGENFKIPNEIIIHHGNWTVGLENKFKLLEYVKNNR